MDFAYRPKSPEWEGTITLSMPTFDDRMAFLEELNVDIGEDGNIAYGEGASKLGMIRKMVKASKRHYKAVDLKRKSDDKPFKSFDDLSMDPSASVILMEVANEVLTSGLQMGNG